MDDEHDTALCNDDHVLCECPCEKCFLHYSAAIHHLDSEEVPG